MVDEFNMMELKMFVPRGLAGGGGPQHPQSRARTACRILGFRMKIRKMMKPCGNTTKVSRSLAANRNWLVSISLASFKDGLISNLFFVSFSYSPLFTLLPSSP